MGSKTPTAGGLIRRARNRAGLSQAQLAAQAGVTQSVISAYESGQRQPSIPALTRLIEAAGFELTLGVRRQRACAGCRGQWAAECATTGMT